MAKSHLWTFRARFRRNAYGWNGTSKAISSLKDAVAEIQKVARVDPLLAAEGAVLLLEKLSPALSGIDSSSGALGNACAAVVDVLVPMIASASVTQTVRQKWLDRLFAAVHEDDPPYIESLGEYWGVLCADTAMASHWVDELLPHVRQVLADRRTGIYAYTRSGTLCYSALFHAGRFDDLLALLATDPKPYWHDQQWAAKALAARGDVDGAVKLMEGLRSSYAPDIAISAVAEQLLLNAGRANEAYERYAIQATSANTHLATYRSLAKRYPHMEPSRILSDLIASTPGEEGKWFATAKTLKQYDLALALAKRSPVDPRTLVRAARDHIQTQSAFAMEVGLLALHWMAGGYGYELTAADVFEARQHLLAAAQVLGLAEVVEESITQALAVSGASAIWMRKCLGLEGV
jgi:hypothetical protein